MRSSFAPEKILLTGGAGFIGSHAVDYLLDVYPEAEIRVLDKFTYAADRSYLASAMSSGRASIIDGDICQFQTVKSAADGIDLIIHFAAESHVDHSFSEPGKFTNTNVVGTQLLLEAMREMNVPRFIHISTDEVYGDEAVVECGEDAGFKPTNPYAASKAAAEMIIRGYRRSYGLNIDILRPNNIIGTRQYPEKLIPRFIALASLGRPLTIHGTGHQTRSFLAVSDFCRALHTVIEAEKPSDTYNVSSPNEHSILEIAKQIKTLLPDRSNSSGINLIYENGRQVNDECYHISGSKLAALGWQPQLTLQDLLPEIIDWYLANPQKMSLVGSQMAGHNSTLLTANPGAIFAARPYLPDYAKLRA